MILNSYTFLYLLRVSLNEELVWGYGWQGTYAGAMFMGNLKNWSKYGNAENQLKQEFIQGYGYPPTDSRSIGDSSH